MLVLQGDGGNLGFFGGKWGKCTRDLGRNGVEKRVLHRVRGLGGFELLGGNLGFLERTRILGRTEDFPRILSPS